MSKDIEIEKFGYLEIMDILTKIYTKDRDQNLTYRINLLKWYFLAIEGIG